MDDTNSHRGVSAASGLYVDQKGEKNTNNRRLVGSEINPYMTQHNQMPIDGEKATEVKFSATTGNPLILIGEDRPIKAGGFNFYDMNDSVSARSKSNDQKSPLNISGYNSSRAIPDDPKL